MILGNIIWNQRVAALLTQGKPLYTFEVPDEGIILTSFDPALEDVTLDIPALIAQPLWFNAALQAAGLRAVSLVPVLGFTLPGTDGTASATPPQAIVERFNYGAGITSWSAYLSWRGIVFPPGMQDIRKAVSINLVMVSSLIEGGGYAPYANVGYSVNGQAAELATWFTALNDDTPGWTDRTDTLRLWPGNVDVGTVMPDVTKIIVKVSQVGLTTGSSPSGNIFQVAPTLLVSFL